MAEIQIEDSLNGIYICTVIENDPQTRRLAVYIPKLMPVISEDKFEATTLTNYGQTLNIPYDNNIQIRNSIWVNARDYNEPLPKPGSKVYVRFIEDDPTMGIWEKFNQNNDYEVIDAEKYKYLYTATIRENSFKINEADNLVLSLPDNFKIIKSENDKTKTFTITDTNETIKKLNDLITKVGNASSTQSEIKDGRIVVNEEKATGLTKNIEDLETNLNSAQTNIASLSSNKADKTDYANYYSTAPEASSDSPLFYNDGTNVFIKIKNSAGVFSYKQIS